MKAQLRGSVHVSPAATRGTSVEVADPLQRVLRRSSEPSDGRSLADRGRDLGELRADFRCDFVEPGDEALHARTVGLRHVRNLTDEASRLREVRVDRLAHQRVPRLGNVQRTMMPAAHCGQLVMPEVI